MRARVTILFVAVFAVWVWIDGRAVNTTGTGDVRFPAVVGVLTSWACTPPLMWLLGYRMNLGAFGGWLGLCGETIIGALVRWRRLERGSWRAAAASARATLRVEEGPAAA